MQLLEQELAQFQTSDNNSVALQTYVTWRIVDPYRFFVALQNVEKARDVLGTQMSNLLGEVSRYRFDQLVNLDPAQIKLGEIEDQLHQPAARGGGPAGLRRGDRAGRHPAAGAARVHHRKGLRADAQHPRAAGRQRHPGRPERGGPYHRRGRAGQGADPQLRQPEATKIRSEGLKDAGTRYATFADNTELAVFLRQVDTMKKMLPGSTLVLDANALEFLNLIRTPVVDGADDASATEGTE